MSVRDVGDGHPIGYEARDPDTGDLVNATVALAVVDPAGNSTSQSPSNPSTGVYEYTIDLTSAGLWRWVWTVSGAVEDKAYGEVFAADPAPGLYATVPDLRRELGLGTDGGSDDQLAAALASVSREIDEYCGVPPGAFRPQATASARVFEPESHCLVRVDPFYTTTGLIVKTDDGSGTYPTTWATSDFQTEPLNAVAYGKPVTAIRAVRMRFPCWYGPASVQVTAKWGWPSVPDPVRQACLMLAATTHKLSTEAPFGVAGFDQFGAVRVRDNPVAREKLGPYQRFPVLVA